VRSLAHGFEKLPIFLVLLIILFGVYTWKKTQELSEMRGLMRGLEQHDEAGPAKNNSASYSRSSRVLSRLS